MPGESQDRSQAEPQEAKNTTSDVGASQDHDSASGHGVTPTITNQSAASGASLKRAISEEYPEGYPDLFRHLSDSSNHSAHAQQDKKEPDIASAPKPLPVDEHPAPPAAPVLEDFDSDSEDEEDTDPHAFDHPSTYVEQPWIWIPRDELGLSEMLVKELTEAGVGASNRGTKMDEKGVVEVTRGPPDEEWSGGNDQ